MTIKELKKQLERFTEDREIIFTWYHQTRHGGASYTGTDGKTLLINDTTTGKVEIYNTDREN